MYSFFMDPLAAEIWIAACAHELHKRWRTVNPDQLDEVAADLWADERLRAMSPVKAAVEWLAPVVREPASRTMR
jgi:hypothetical protein